MVSSVSEVTCDIDIDWLWCNKLYWFTFTFYRVLAIWADHVNRLFSKLDLDLGQGLCDHHQLRLRLIASVHRLSCNHKKMKQDKYNHHVTYAVSFNKNLTWDVQSSRYTLLRLGWHSSWPGPEPWLNKIDKKMISPGAVGFNMLVLFQHSFYF